MTDATQPSSATTNLPAFLPSPAQAAAELLKRRAARRNLQSFIEYTKPDYAAASHHRLIIDRLEAVECGECPRLMVFMPPRMGKSEIASRRFPAWFIGRNPGKQLIAASYNSDLATDFGREVRNIVASPEYQKLFPGSALSVDSQAANRWHTTAGGVYVAAGVGTAMTGRGAHVLLIDDPVKDREEADSEVMRERAWNWYTSTARTRLMPGGAIVVIQTRWHEADLAGRLIEAQENGGDQWEILSLPALNEHDESLWPEWYPTDELRQTRAATPPRDWFALYQQQPTPEGGNYFKREWVRWYDDAPRHLAIYGASDYAVTDKGGDFTVHGVIGVDPDDNIYVLDWWRQQTDSLGWIEAFCDLVEKWRPRQWGEESGQIAKSVGPLIDKRQAERSAYCWREQYPSAHDKSARAQAIRGRMAQGRVYFPHSAPWAAGLINELMAFPAGTNDDQVDALSLFGRMLNEMHKGRVPPLPKGPPKGIREISFNDAARLIDEGRAGRRRI